MDIIIFYLAVLIFSVVIHEVSHGSAALMLGDSTAKNANRLTLNPLPHLDFMGSFLMPIFLLILTQGQGPIFGWAKPVPVNPYNLRNPRWDMAKVAMAGAGANFALALAFGLALRLAPIPAQLAVLFSGIVTLNLLLGIFNLAPIPPLDGSKVLFAFIPDRFFNFKLFLERYGPMFLIFFIFFFGFIRIIFPIVSLAYYIIVGQPPLI
ncbi:MAG: hypothetical protein A2667_01185 [Candidatus Wildermuthbacteria bacterium RIFCSPHIGHO2_01_FULL_47_27]|uniref:Peptidase M50 domain-containing protein n=1 Tax=Candidatus Wildermuthbacteria bacterium RIFCSPHIGHO2_02_FULL_47_17 TaxID=1802452 RepID=A0A1G2R2T5_9BACT|nr:MAG: hypothetical protein A2667_01185 [Candidatus Wildermuthbacteria bacterium RIFCSPHIGHO2_01_FULL_47_27]OHA67146.1 MAG: hypothetical protein A3D59_02655 [Candidatus Wildermuthbacteria bacterium RIFCSPHIGHO2_02_FULL_47_17]